MTDHDALVALSPLDGRYAGQAEALRPHFSEFGLIRSRVRVELAWLAALSDEPGVPEVPPFDAAARLAIASAESSKDDEAATVTPLERVDARGAKACGL